MRPPEGNLALLRSQRLFERLLALYPRPHRQQYGPAMAQLFRDQSRDAWRSRRAWGLLALWFQVVPDLVATSILEHLSTLKGRKTMLEKISEITSPGLTPLRSFLTVSVIVFLMVFGATAVVTFLLPETYASVVRIRIEPAAAASGQPTLPATGWAYDPYLIQTEFEILRSSAVLGEVVERLGLSAKWGSDREEGQALTIPEAIQLLAARVEVRPVRNTSLLEIRAFSSDPNEAAAIANTVADVYHYQRVEKRRQLVLDGISALEKQFNEHEQKIHEAQLEVDQLRKILHISGADAVADASSPSLEADTVRQLHGHLITAETALAREQTTLRELEKLTAEQRRDAIQTTIGADGELVNLLNEHHLARQRLTALQTDYSAESPVYLNAKGLADETARRIEQRVDGMMIGLKARVSVQQAAVQELKTRLEMSRASDIEKAERSRPFYEARRRLDELMRFRSTLDLKLASERLGAALPQAALVEIIDRASPGLQSVRPNKPRNLFLGAMGGIALGALAGAAFAGGSFWIRRKPPAAAVGG
jgi:succinoglycan biosynthesis transport protein ExoP